MVAENVKSLVEHRRVAQPTANTTLNREPMTEASSNTAPARSQIIDLMPRILSSFTGSTADLEPSTKQPVTVEQLYPEADESLSKYANQD